MRVTRREKIEKVIKTLEDQIRILKSMGLHDCASLISIAWLDLRRRNDRISIKELQALCDHVTGCSDDRKLVRSGPKKSPRRVAAKPGGAAQVERLAVKSISGGTRSRRSARIIDMQAWRSRVPRYRL